MKINKIINNPFMPFIYFLSRLKIFNISDETYLKHIYKYEMGKKLNLKNPKTYNEKLQWLKLYDRKDIYTTMVDKYEAKKYVAKIIGEEYIVPTLAIYNSFDEINFDKLPNRFVIKCTHDSGGLYICKDKRKINIKKVKKIINKSLNTNFYLKGREWPYKNVKPRILIEKYMEDEKYHELRDYKIYAFNGSCDYLMLCMDRFIDKTKFLYFDKNWKLMKEFSKDGIKYGDSIKVDKPKCLEKMFEFASILSKNIKFVRVDFYEVNGHLFFGELTFFPSSGFDNTRTIKCQEYLDNKLVINNSKKEI